VSQVFLDSMFYGTGTSNPQSTKYRSKQSLGLGFMLYLVTCFVCRTQAATVNRDECLGLVRGWVGLTLITRSQNYMHRPSPVINTNYRVVGRLRSRSMHHHQNQPKLTPHAVIGLPAVHMLYNLTKRCLTVRLTQQSLNSTTFRLVIHSALHTIT